MIQNHSITQWQRSGMNNLYSDQILTATPPHNFLWVGWAIDTSKEFALKRSGCSTSRLHRGHKRQKVDFGPRAWDFYIKNVTTKHCSTWVHIYSVLCLQHTGTHAESNPDQDTSLLLSMNVALLIFRYLMYELVPPSPSEVWSLPLFETQQLRNLGCKKSGNPYSKFMR